jgi:hypothetical protein
MSRLVKVLFFVALVVVLMAFGISVAAQSEHGSSSRPRKDMITVKIMAGKAIAHNFQLDINPNPEPGKVDYESEHKFMVTTAGVDCFDDCPFYWDSSVFSAAYRKDSDTVTLVLHADYPKKRKCSIKETVVVSRKNGLKLKRPCGIEISVTFENVEEGFSLDQVRIPAGIHASLLRL